MFNVALHFHDFMQSNVFKHVAHIISDFEMCTACKRLIPYNKLQHNEMTDYCHFSSIICTFPRTLHSCLRRNAIVAVYYLSLTFMRQQYDNISLVLVRHLAGLNENLLNVDSFICKINCIPIRIFKGFCFGMCTSKLKIFRSRFVSLVQYVEMNEGRFSSM